MVIEWRDLGACTRRDGGGARVRVSRQVHIMLGQLVYDVGGKAARGR